MPGIRYTILLGLLALLFLPSRPAEAVRGYTERDYIIDRYNRFQGYEPVLYEPYTISVSDTRWDQVFGYVMSKDRTLLLEITPVTASAGVIMFGSETGSPRCLKAVWAHDNITEPIRFWTDRFWSPDDRECDNTYTDCPRIMFRATSGTLGVSVLERKK
ncbi:MAG: hypothetical protein ACOZF0_04180 [Thermodesulfobacteriota bacterium]